MKIYNENNELVDTNAYENPEQTLVKKHIHEDDIVLELGARYGAVSCSINQKLKNKKHQVSVEPDSTVWACLEKNRNINRCEFHIVKGLIGKKKYKIVYNKAGTHVIEDSTSTAVQVFPLEHILSTFKLNFNVLIVDCEGCLDTFINENEYFFQNLRLVIFEADRPDHCDYNKIRSFLTRLHFVEVETIPYSNWEKFQNVWVRNSVEHYIGIL